MMHALIIHGGVGFLGRHPFGKKYTYNVGGFTFSLLELEHAVIRGANAPPRSLFPRFDDQDPRKKFVLPKDERYNFVIHYGTVSSPDFLIMEHKRIDSQLDRAVVETLMKEITIKREKGKCNIFLPKLMDWFHRDFPDKELLITWLNQMLSNRNMNIPYLSDEDCKISHIKYSGYEWDFMYDFRDKSIALNPEKHHQLITSIPKLELKSLSNQNRIIEFYGPPDGESEQAFLNYVSARCVSTYPRKSHTERIGDPICDQYGISIYENRTVIALADGCSWGERPRKAAEIAIKTIQDYIKPLIGTISTTHQAANALLCGFRQAHENILKNVNYESMEAGTTTMIAGIEFELENPEKDKKFCFTFVNLGDCKAFHVNGTNGVVNEVSSPNRNSTTDVKDPGGRLGPFGPMDTPDIRNISVCNIVCQEGDLIFVCSDGVHDNFNPFILGKTPREVNLKLSHKSWTEQDEDKAEAELSEQAKEDFMYKLMRDLILPVNSLTVNKLSDNLMKHCIQITQAGRDFMEKNPSMRQSEDHSQFPGKMDHASVAVFRIGRKKRM